MTSHLRTAASDSLMKDVAARYGDSSYFRETYERLVLDHLPLHKRVITIVLTRVLSLLTRGREVPWDDLDLVLEVRKRAGIGV